MKFASLCVLAYKRPKELEDCLQSIIATVDYPCEIIVNVDSDGTEYANAAQIAYAHFRNKEISKLILSNGNNRGVGRSFQNCLGMAEGEYIFKVDTDLTFKPKWLSKAVNILKNNEDVGAVSLFNYRNYDPKDERFTIKEIRNDCLIVSDFVSSIYGFRKEDAYRYDDGPLYMERNIPDDGLHQKMNGKLAITKEDFVINSGFGLGKSTYVVADAEGNPVKAQTYPEPFVFEL